MKQRERKGNGMLKRIGRVVGASFGRGGDGDEPDGVERRGYSSRRVVDRIGIPLVSRDDVDWTPARYGEYYAQSTAVHLRCEVGEGWSTSLESATTKSGRGVELAGRVIHNNGCWSVKRRMEADSCCE